MAYSYYIVKDSHHQYHTLVFYVDDTYSATSLDILI